MERQGRAGGGQNAHGRTGEFQPKELPIIASLEAEKVGLKDQSCVRQGRLSNALPTKGRDWAEPQPVLY